MKFLQKGEKPDSYTHTRMDEQASNEQSEKAGFCVFLDYS